MENLKQYFKLPLLKPVCQIHFYSLFLLSLIWDEDSYLKMVIKRMPKQNTHHRLKVLDDFWLKKNH